MINRICPLDLLPKGILRDQVLWQSQRCPNQNLWLHTAGVMVQWAFLLGRAGFRVGVSEGSADYIQLVACLFGNSGSGKGVVQDILQRVGRRLITSPHSTITPFVEVMDFTIPGLLGAIRPHYDEYRQETWALLYTHELTRLLKSQDSATSEVLIQLLDGYTYTVLQKQYQKGGKRAGEDPTVLNPRLCGIVCTNSDNLRSVNNLALFGGGLGSRFWWVPSGEVAKESLTPFPPFISPEDVDEMATRLEQHWFEMRYFYAVSANTSHFLRISDTAKNLVTLTWQERHFAAQQRNLPTAGVISREPRLIARLAAIMAATSCRAEISVEDIHIATIIVHSSTSACEAIRTKVERSTIVDENTTRDAILEIIERSMPEGITQTCLIREASKCRPRITREQVAKAISQLNVQGENMIEYVDRQTGGRPAKVWLLRATSRDD